MPIQILRTNHEAQLCKIIYLLSFLFVLQKGCLKLEPLLSMAATTSWRKFGQFPRRSDSPMQHDASTYLTSFSTPQVSIHHSLLLNTER